MGYKWLTSYVDFTIVIKYYYKVLIVSSPHQFLNHSIYFIIGFQIAIALFLSACHRLLLKFWLNIFIGMFVHKLHFIKRQFRFRTTIKGSFQLIVLRNLHYDLFFYSLL